MPNSKMTDESVLNRIQGLVHEEQSLYARESLDSVAQDRLQVLRVELDQCWDLLRQRRALREFGKDPDQAEVRSPDIVEKYEQ